MIKPTKSKIATLPKSCLTIRLVGSSPFWLWAERTFLKVGPKLSQGDRPLTVFAPFDLRINGVSEDQNGENDRNNEDDTHRPTSYGSSAL